MTEIFPTKSDIDRLLAFLPSLYRPAADASASPISPWSAPGETSSPAFPVYSDAVTEFFMAAGAPCWCDFGYDPQTTAALLESKEFVANARMSEIRTLLTYCVRGERFCDGFWGSLIESGKILLILKRLEQLRSQME